MDARLGVAVVISVDVCVDLGVVVDASEDSYVGFPFRVAFVVSVNEYVNAGVVVEVRVSARGVVEAMVDGADEDVDDVLLANIMLLLWTSLCRKYCINPVLS